MSKLFRSIISSVTLSVASVSYPLSEDTDKVVTLGDLSFAYPLSWVYSSNKPGVTAQIEAPTASRNEFKRNLQIRTYREGLFLTKSSVQDFAEEMVRNFEKASGSIREYSMRNAELVDLSSGVKAGVIYASFKINDFPLMHMHVLVSSANNHYAITATDFEDMLDGTGDDDHLAEFWEIVNTINIKSAPENPNSDLLWFGVVFVVCLGSFIGFKLLKRRSESLDFAKFEANPVPEDKQHAHGKNEDELDGNAEEWSLSEGGELDLDKEDASHWNTSDEDIDKALDEKFK